MAEPTPVQTCKSFAKCVERGIKDIHEALDETKCEFNMSAVASLSKCLYDYISHCADAHAKNLSDEEREIVMEMCEHSMQIHLSAIRLLEAGEKRKKEKY
ncbi:MAG: hypothetical protein WC792_01205 [Candidatus Micrarchaeia archaeon]